VAIVNRHRPHEIVDTVDRADVVVLADAVDVDAVDATVVHGSKLLRRPTKKPAQPAGFPCLGVLGRGRGIRRPTRPKEDGGFAARTGRSAGDSERGSPNHKRRSL
jgi:hypothetical protein